MSGIAVGYGRPDRRKVEAMADRMAHRGPDASGVYAHRGAVMAQCYLDADGLRPGEKMTIPYAVEDKPDLRICYDGQVGNFRGLARTHGIADGPLSEERLLLDLYGRYGKGMLAHLDDAIFALVISDGEEFLAARDLLGIKTLFYGRQDNSLYLSSELKGLYSITSEVHEFPPGHMMDREGQLTPFGRLPETPPTERHTNHERIIEDIRDIIFRSVEERVDFRYPTGCLLSGGIDSSVIAFLAHKVRREKTGERIRLPTFALGMGESEDIRCARLIADALDSDHHEVLVSLDEALAVLPDVIYQLESFDPSLVRSAVSNYLISRYAQEKGIQVLLSGEGGDEVFCGYTYLKSFPLDEVFSRQMECMGFLHNNAALRLDRMNLCHSIKVVAPLISGELLRYALTLPPEYKIKPQNGEKIEKWIFRKAFECILPGSIVWRSKQEFSQGSGSAALMPAYFESEVSRYDWSRERTEYPFLRSKEELYYFQLFKKHFDSPHAVQTVGQWISI